MPDLMQRGRLKEFAIVFGGNACAGVAILGGLKAVTWKLDPEEYAVYVLGLSVTIFATQLIYGPIAAGAMRLMADAQQTGEVLTCRKAVRVLLFQATALFALFAVMGYAALHIWSPRHASVTGLGAITAIIVGIINVMEGCLSAHRRRGVVALSSGLGQLLRNGGAVVGAMAGSGIAATLGYLIGALAQVIVLVQVRDVVFAVAPVTGTARDWANDILSYCKPFFLWGVPMAVYAVSDRWSLELFDQPSAVAIYAAALQLVQLPVNFLFSVILLFTGPHLFAIAGAAMRETAAVELAATIRSGIKRLIIAGTVLTVCVFFGGRSLLTLLTNESYAAAAPLLVPVFLAAFIYQVGQWSALYQLTLRSPKRLLAPKIATGVSGIVLCSLGAAFGGASGVAWSTVIVAIAYACWVTLDAIWISDGGMGNVKLRYERG